MPLGLCRRVEGACRGPIYFRDHSAPRIWLIPRQTHGAIPQELNAPAEATASDVARTRASMRAQASEQLAKLASIDRQIQQKLAESQSITASIAKIDATLPLVEEQATVRRNAMEIQYGTSPIFDAQTRLVDQQNERIVQQHKMIEIDAARPGLEQQIAQTRAAYEHQVLNDLSDAEKKVAEFSQDLVKAEQKVDEQILRSPIDGTVQQLSSPSAVSPREFRGFRTSGG